MVNFKLGNEDGVNDTDERGTEKIPDRNRTHDLPNTWRALYRRGTRTHGENGHLTEFMCDRRPAF